MSKFLGEDDLITNTASRVPVCLCLDVSGSMYDVIGELEDGVDIFCNAVKNDSQAKDSCELSIVTFNDSARLYKDFTGVENISRPSFSPNGGTAINQGVEKALDALEKRKQKYKANGVDYFQPWLVIMSDGYPTCSDSELASAQAKTKRLEADKKLVIFPIGIGPDADMDALSGFSGKRRALSLKNMNFAGFFEFLSKSISIVSRSRPGELVKLDTSSMDEWANI